MKKNYAVVFGIIVSVFALYWLFFRITANRQYRVIANQFDLDTGNYNRWHTKRKILSDSRFIFKKHSVYLTEDKSRGPACFFRVDTAFTINRGDSLITVLNGRVSDAVDTIPTGQVIKIVTMAARTRVSLHYLNSNLYGNYYFDAGNSSVMHDYQLLFSISN